MTNRYSAICQGNSVEEIITFSINRTGTPGHLYYSYRKKINASLHNIHKNEIKIAFYHNNHNH